MIDTKDFQNFKEIHEKEIKKIQSDMIEAGRKINIAMGELLAAQFFMSDGSDGNAKISMSIEGNLPRLEMECSRSQAIFFVYEVLNHIYDGDFKRAFSDVAAFEVFFYKSERANRHGMY